VRFDAHGSDPGRSPALDRAHEVEDRRDGGTRAMAELLRRHRRERPSQREKEGERGGGEPQHLGGEHDHPVILRVRASCRTTISVRNTISAQTMSEPRAAMVTALSTPAEPPTN